MWFAQGGSGGDGEKNMWIQDILLSQMDWICFVEQQREFEERRFPLGNWVAWIEIWVDEDLPKGGNIRKSFSLLL